MYLDKVKKEGYRDFIRVISIDPGSNCCGMSVVELNLKTGRVRVVKSHTVFSKNIVKSNETEMLTIGERLLRNLAYSKYLGEMCKEWEPNEVACEAAYAGKFIKAYEALTEHLTCLRIGVYNWKRLCPFRLIGASVVKKAMKVSGNSGDKELMRKALMEDKHVDINKDIDVRSLDEHSVDSCCVGIAYLRQLWTTIQPKQMRGY